MNMEEDLYSMQRNIRWLIDMKRMQRRLEGYLLCKGKM